MLKSLLTLTCLLLLSSFSLAREVLMVGDSLTCGPFGQNMISQLARSGHSVTMYCAVSTSAINWIQGTNPPKVEIKNGRRLKTVWPCEKFITHFNGSIEKKSCDGSVKVPTFDSLLKQYPNHDVMVALGTNSLPGAADSNYDLTMKKITVDHSKKCIFLGPPHLVRSDLEAGLSKFYNSITTLAKNNQCKLFDSRNSTARGTPGNASVPDKVHKTNAAGQYWARQMSPSVSSFLKSGTPILAATAASSPARSGLNRIFQREQISSGAR